MVTRAYHDWVAAGKPWSLAQPIGMVGLWAQRNRVKVLGTIGNHDHLTSDHPEDHTPFSVTQWPIKLAKPIVCAIDLANVTRHGVTLGAAIERQMRDGKLPWIKYLNHGGRHIDARDTDGDGKRYEVEQSDDEHVHISIRTDWANRSIGAFDPWEETERPMDESSIVNSARIRIYEKTAEIIEGKPGDMHSLGDLLQHTLGVAGDARTVGGALAKQILALAAAQEYDERLIEEKLKSMSERIDAILTRVNEIACAVVHPPEVPSGDDTASAV